MDNPAVFSAAYKVGRVREDPERSIEDPSRRKFGKLHAVERFRELKQTSAFIGPRVRADLIADTTELLASDTAAVIHSSIAARLEQETSTRE